MELKRLGKYEIVAKIGEGGMGEVHRAHDPVLNRDVAIKTLAAGGDAAGDLRKRFHREAQSAAGLNHPNIVTVHDFGEEQGYMYIAMELLEGSDLRQAIKRKRPLGLDAKLELMDQICDGVAFAHARDIIHRDLKPANIHVLPNGRIKIMDFGLARFSKASDLTGAGVVLGTPNYMSPEQVRGEKATTRSDVFALGVVFYELLSGRKAFDADTLAGVLLQVAQVEPAPLDRVQGEVAGAVARVVQRAIAKDPASRYAHAGELREAVRDARRAIVLAARFRQAMPATATGATLSAAATLPRAAEPRGSAGASLPVVPQEPSPPQVTVVPATTRRPEEIGTLTVSGAGAKTVTTPATAPKVAPPRSVRRSVSSPEKAPRVESREERRRAPSARVALGAGLGLVGLLLAAGIRLHRSERPRADRAVTAHPSSTAAPPTVAPAPPSPAPSAAKPSAAPVPASPAPSEHVITLPGPQSEAAARQAIRGVLDEYRAAFERRDAEALRAVQPGVDYERMKDRFASVTGYTVRIDVKDVTVEGDRGTATCVVTYLPQPKPSQKIPPQKTVFHLRRTGDVWLIERLEAM